MEKGITFSDSRSIVVMVLAIAAVLVGLTFYSLSANAEGGSGFPPPCTPFPECLPESTP